MPLINLAQFWGGESNTETSPSGQPLTEYLYSENLNLKKTTEYFTLSKRPELKCLTGGDLMLCTTDETDNTVDTFVFGENGQIYSTDGTLVYTMSTPGRIVNAAVFGDLYIWWYEFQPNNIRLATIDKANANFVSWNPGDVNENFGSPANGFFKPNWITRVPYYNDSEDFLYYAGDKSVYRIQVGTPFVEKGITLEDQVVGLTRVNGLYRIYLLNGKVYFWDGVSLQHDYTIDTRKIINRVWNYIGTDYAILGNAPTRAELGVFNGQGFTTIKKANVTDIDAERYYFDIENEGGNYHMAWYNNQIFMTDDAQDENNGVHISSYGQQIPGIQPAYTKNTYVNSQGDDVSDYGMLRVPRRLPDADKLYVSWRSGGTCGIDEISDFAPSFVSTGYLKTMRLDFGNPYEKKRIKELSIRYDAPTDTQVVISYALDGDDNFTTLYTLTGTDIRYRNNPSVPEFQDIVLKIELVTTDDSSTPKFYNMIVNYEPVRY